MKPHDGAMTDGGDDSGLIAEINVTPFIDVMLVLLIVFMVAAPLMMAGVPLSLPKSSAAALAPPKEPLVVSMDKDGRIFIGDEAADSATLPEKLTRMTAEDPGRTVHVRCDKELDYGRIMELLGVIGQGGVASISLVAEGAQAVGAERGGGPSASGGSER
ncbi:biopolymer transport protein TolR [Humidesulfovibrio mexicanus]|uniref:Biopolymer transport protein TolR n=1 Tax=Humidesulfovibrio mexicanus TaxID=147047 RepID=A0A239A5T2_9BACT|nr:ExbD/TolR family protein [Humidesulfovibrio mexicanus]SNR91016.1 biopolymer transport protein TolR [Humidesulfovibrio mexicanus]